MTRLRATLIGLAAGAVAAGAGFSVYNALAPDPFPVPDAVPLAVTAGNLAAITFATLTGERQAIVDWKAPYLIVNFWGTWCTPCLREIPGFIRLQDEFADHGVQFIGVAVDEVEPVREYAARQRLNYPALLGESEALQLNLLLGNRNGALPFTAVLDSTRNVIFAHQGEWPYAEAADYLAALIEKHKSR